MPEITTRRHRSPRPVLLTAAVALLAPAIAVSVASSASASTTPKSPVSPSALKKGILNCPVSNPAVTECLYSVTTSGSFTIGGTTLALTSPVKVTLGLIPLGGSNFATVNPTNGTPALQGMAIDVPGGLLGIPGSPGPLAVTALPQLVGQPTFNLFQLETRSGPAFTLPLDVLLSNPLLGTSCTIGSPSDPIALGLTDGTTNPPAPNKPISGSIGQLKFNQKTGSLTDNNVSLVDNSFAVGGTAGCGPLGVLDPVINQKEGLPSAAGNNAATLSGTAFLEPASSVRSAG